MKHNLKITIILLSMFVITQFIGLAVLQADIFHLEQEINGTIETVPNPHLSWIQPPEVETQKESFSMLGSLIFAFIIAISLLILLSKFKIRFILKAWFFLVVCIALFLTIYAFEKLVPFSIPSNLALIIPVIIALPLAFIKIFKREFLVHNFTELLIYPGIAAVFVPILKIYTIIIFLIIISIYDIWAVWHSGIMQKMAKYQIDKLNIFPGFFVPYVSKKIKSKIKKMKKSELKKKKIRVNVAILGGGDIIFPIITAGVMLNNFGFFPALFVIAGATLGLCYLFFFSEKRKFYPAMPFITTGIFAGMILSWIIF
jgi:presenilin-like A22 family membrane protease